MKKEKSNAVHHQIIPELVSESSTQAVAQQQPLKTLKKFQGFSCFITARGFTQTMDFLSLEGEGGTPCRVRGKEYKANLICTPSSALRASSPSRGKWSRAFTLIELLVVVLIIGILAAVAVPQYTKAVRKARIAEAKVILKRLTDAQDVWYLSHGDVPSFDDLDIEIPESTNLWHFYTDECAGVEGGNGAIGCKNHAVPQWENGYEIGYASPNYSSGLTDYDGHFFCTDDETICTNLGGVPSERTDYIYILP